MEAEGWVVVRMEEVADIEEHQAEAGAKGVAQVERLAGGGVATVVATAMAVESAALAAEGAVGDSEGRAEGAVAHREDLAGAAGLQAA
ncbi:hypothetical protein AB1Y20_012281 [Prymnesium parvum]|uniref:Uncharacterized protein n=1 Tax=Prymnesium parvum TaxID=97485 RepID=A0AB34IQT0_PRYPA